VQHPFSVLEKSLFVEALSLAYGSFIYGDRHASTIFNGEDFLDSDAALFGIISRLSAAACLAIDTGKPGIDGDFLSILVSSPPIDYTCSQASDIHSPGFTRNISGKQVAIVISALTAALIALGHMNTKAETQNAIDNLIIVNTAPDADPLCNAYVQDATRRILKNRDIDTTIKLCQEMRRAAERANIRPSAVPALKANIANNGAKPKHKR
jgi:hypothetical protein